MPAGAALLGFLEGSFIFFPIEPIAIPIMATRHRNAFVVALYILAGNIIGAVLMYGLGAVLTEAFIMPAFAYLGAADQYARAAAALREDGFMAIVLFGITPLVFQVGTAAAGAVGFSFPLFLAAVVLSRGVRYIALALVVAMIGVRAADFIERHESSIFIFGVILFFATAAVMMLY